MSKIRSLSLIPVVFVSSIAGCKPAATDARALHYDFVLSVTEGDTTKRTAFTMDVSENAPGSATVGKNVVLRPGARSDVGVDMKGWLTMDGDVPRLDAETKVSAVDAAGKMHELATRGAMRTAMGSTVTLVDQNEDGIHYRLTATPAATPDLGASIPSTARESHVVDVVAKQIGATTKTTSLTLALSGDTPATATTRENVPLTVSYAGAVATPRQDTGTRVKASARPHRGGLELDFDLEMSAAEPGGGRPGVAIRKLRAHGPVLARFDQPTTAFVADEDGARYEVTVTPHRAK